MWKSITFKDNWFVYTCILKLFDTVLAKISDQAALIISVVLCCYPMETTLYSSMQCILKFVTDRIWQFLIHVVELVPAERKQHKSSTR